VIHVSVQRGNDANPGTFAAPVREIAKGVELAVAGDTVVVLDSGTYSPFVVSKSLTVAAEGVKAEIVAPATSANEASLGQAVRVDPPAADSVVLRGLTIRSAGLATGVWFVSGSLRIEHCTICNFVPKPNGLQARALDAHGAQLTVTDTLFRDNQVAIAIGHSPVARAVQIDRCRIVGNGQMDTIGVQVQDGNRVCVSNSIVANCHFGLYASGRPGVLGFLTIAASTVMNNIVGVGAGSGGQVHLAATTVSLNDSATNGIAGGIIYTSGNNALIGNFARNIGPGTMFFKSDLSV
jgi:hypothetical protein